MEADLWRVFFEAPTGAIDKGLVLDLSSANEHHLIDVLRLKSGERLCAICSETGLEYLAELDRSSSPAKIRIIKQINSEPIPRPRVASLSFALCKGKRNDMVVEKATELGVSSLNLWEAQRSVVKLPGTEDALSTKRARWERIAEAAAKQSKKRFVPSIHLPRSTEQLINIINKNSREGDRRLLCSLSPEAIPLPEVDPPRASLHLLIGPEGDFSEEEERRFCDDGFERVSLGPHLLRSDTAAVTALAMTQGLWGYSA